MHTQSRQEAGCSFLRAQHLDETVIKFFSHPYHLQKNKTTLSSHYKASPPNEDPGAQVAMWPSLWLQGDLPSHHVLLGFPCPQACPGCTGCLKGFRGAQPESALSPCLRGCKDVFPPCIIYYFGNYMTSDGDLHAARMFHSYCEFALNPSVTSHKH